MIKEIIITITVAVISAATTVGILYLGTAFIWLQWWPETESDGIKYGEFLRFIFFVFFLLSLPFTITLLGDDND